MVLKLAGRLVVENIASWVEKIVHEGGALRKVFRIIVSGAPSRSGVIQH